MNFALKKTRRLLGRYVDMNEGQGRFVLTKKTKCHMHKKWIQVQKNKNIKKVSRPE